MVFECMQQDFKIAEQCPKEIIRFENATFVYIFLRIARVEIIPQDMGARMK